MKKLLLIVIITLVYNNYIFPQKNKMPQDSPAFFNTPVFSEIYIKGGSEDSSLFFFYKVPFSRLFFIKENDKYSASFRILVELFDENSKFIHREMIDEKVEDQLFDNTEKDDLYVQGIIKFPVKNQKFVVKSIFSDENSKKDWILRGYIIDPDSLRELSNPLVVKKEAEEPDILTLANFEGNIPFSTEKTLILIPVKKNIESLYVKVVNNDSTIFNSKLNRIKTGDFEFSEKNNNIFLTISENNGYSLFMLEDINSKIYEGKINIFTSIDGNYPEKSISKYVKWYNKPLSLIDVDFAIDALEVIEKEDVIKEIGAGRPHDKEIKLFNYWKKYDTDKSNTFNPVMEEFYRRVDYVMENYSIFNKKKGTDTDRGKTYIKLGKPDNIERITDEDGFFKEIWKYKNPDKTLYFSNDQSGDYILEE